METGESPHATETPDKSPKRPRLKPHKTRKVVKTGDKTGKKRKAGRGRADANQQVKDAERELASAEKALNEAQEAFKKPLAASK
jgi:hypothetical protein